MFVADAETMEDLKAVASLSALDGLLFAGSSGLAEALAKNGGDAKPALPRFSQNRALFVIGSVTPTSAAQCDRLVSVRRARLKSSCFPPSCSRIPVEEKRRLLGLNLRSLEAVRASHKDQAALLRRVRPTSRIKRRASSFHAFSGSSRWKPRESEKYVFSSRRAAIRPLG